MRGEPSGSGPPKPAVPSEMLTRSCQATKTVPSPVTAAVGKPLERKLSSAGLANSVEMVGWSKGAIGVGPRIETGLLHRLPKSVLRVTMMVSGSKKWRQKT